MRILTDGLGTVGYGAFAVLSSLAGWFALSDFSIAVTLQNYISERRAAELETDDLVFTAATLSLGAALLFAVVLLLAGPWLSNLLLDEFAVLSRSERTLAFYAIAFPSIGTALGGMAYKIWFAQHRGYLSNLLPAAGTVLGTVAVWLFMRSSPQQPLASTLFLYYAASALIPVLALTGIVLAAARHRFATDLLRPLLRRAARFWIFGVLAAAVLQVDYIIMAQVLQAADIVVYNVASKIFQLVFFVYNALLFALWPVCSEAIARGEWARVFALLRRNLVIGIAFTVLCGVGVGVLNGTIVSIVAPTLAEPLPMLVVILLTIYVAVRVWSDTFGMVLQSMNDLTPLLIALPIQAVLSAALQTLGASVAGLPGMIAGLTACFVLTVAWYLPWRCIRYARERTTIETERHAPFDLHPDV
ncbi:MATE family efflux transporter [Sphingomonas guangdongensis]|uniref:MATE family efflux transporter n=1 Tax=Sphingomonas guangdongensis TaxID=1141890 RepID=UPI001181BD2E|nr:MATE family efflux transporter [Sphingomonas guangdongensis]